MKTHDLFLWIAQKKVGGLGTKLKLAMLFLVQRLVSIIRTRGSILIYPGPLGPDAAGTGCLRGSPSICSGHSHLCKEELFWKFGLWYKQLC